MVKFTDINQHYQMNRIKHETFREAVEKKISILKYKFLWFSGCKKENFEYSSPIFIARKFKYNFTIHFLYDDPTNHEPPIKKRLEFSLFFLPPEGNVIEFNDKQFPFNDSLSEIFEEIFALIMQDPSIY
jgi:hypothetical protein